MRSCFPVHPICAAIQSVGICKRDVEHDGTKLGQALLPAVLLHGLFDFWLMVLSVIAFIRAPDILEQTLSPAESQDEEESGKKLETPSLSSLAISFVVVAVGLAYYFWISQQQRQRLNAMMAAQDSDLALALT